MSYSFDINPLVYASDVESPQHEVARAFLAARRDDPELCCVAWPTLMGYIRIVTHPGVLRTPLAPDEALANVEAVLRFPRVLVVTESDGFIRAYQEVTKGQIVRGKLVPDAHLATILFQHGVRTLYTNDSDYRRFPFLRVVNPFAAAAGHREVSRPTQ